MKRWVALERKLTEADIGAQVKTREGFEATIIAVSKYGKSYPIAVDGPDFSGIECYTPEGYYHVSGVAMPPDIVSILEDVQLVITADDVGRRVRLRGGVTSMITAFYPTEDTHRVLVGPFYTTIHGTVYDNHECRYDVMEFLS